MQKYAGLAVLLFIIIGVGAGIYVGNREVEMITRQAELPIGIYYSGVSWSVNMPSYVYAEEGQWYACVVTKVARYSKKMYCYLIDFPPAATSTATPAPTTTPATGPRPTVIPETEKPTFTPTNTSEPYPDPPTSIPYP